MRRWAPMLLSAALGGCVPPVLPPAPSEAYERLSPAAFALHVRRLADANLGGRATGTPGNALAARYVADRFGRAGLTPAGDGGDWFQEFQASYVPDRQPARNVIGRLAGRGGADAPTIVIGAHYDHLAARAGRDGNAEIFPGANDNASGVSAMILVAEALAATPDRRCNFVFVAFGAEEIGFLGSRHYAHHPAAPLSRTAVMINMDEIGCVRGGRLFMIGSLLNPVIRRALERVRGESKAGLKITPVPVTSTRDWSDQAPFARIGLPTLFFYAGGTRHHHTPQDTPDRVNFEGGAQVARLVFEAARALDHEFGLAPGWKVGVPPEKAAARERK